MNRMYIFLLSIILIFFSNSCGKEYDLFDDYKDIAVVYGLINPQDSISYIRIEKAFLSKGDLYQCAQIPDSNLYPYKLDVKLISGSQRIQFDTITIYNKKEGIFYAPKMQVYYAVTKDLLDINNPLDLIINNDKTGSHISSSIAIHSAKDVRIYEPMYFITFEQDDKVVFESIENVPTYQLVLRFHYMEQLPGDPSSQVFKFTDWIFPILRSETLYGNELFTIKYFGGAFYDHLLKTIDATTELERYHGFIELLVYTTDNHFYGYHESTTPSSSLVINRTIYSNIEGALGLFAAKSYKSRLIRINNVSKTHIRNLKGLNFVGGIPEQLF